MWTHPNHASLLHSEGRTQTDVLVGPGSQTLYTLAAVS